jgi:hypothetical protein
MSAPTIIYYGVGGLPADALRTYLKNLGLRVECAHSTRNLLAVVRAVPRPVVILALDASPAVVTRLARQLVVEPSSAFPHVFILYDGETFDAELEAITVITGPGRLSRLVDHIQAFSRLSANFS